MLRIFWLSQVEEMKIFFWGRKAFYWLEKLQFFGADPQNTSVELGKTAVLNCRVQTNDPTTKIQWLRKLDTQQFFRPEAIVFGSEQYENIDQSHEQYYSNNILSKSLIFAHVNNKESGQYICLIQNDKATNYKTAFINILDLQKGKKRVFSILMKDIYSYCFFFQIYQQIIIIIFSFTSLLFLCWFWVLFSS